MWFVISRFWTDHITFNAQVSVSAGPFADMLIPYETVHNNFSSGSVLLTAAESVLQSELPGFIIRAHSICLIFKTSFHYFYRLVFQSWGWQCLEIKLAVAWDSKGSSSATPSPLCFCSVAPPFTWLALYFICCRILFYLIILIHHSSFLEEGCFAVFVKAKRATCPPGLSAVVAKSRPFLWTPWDLISEECCTVVSGERQISHV